MSDTDSPPRRPADAAGTSATAWEFVDDDQVDLRVDDVEDFLLLKARNETDTVLQRLRRRMDGQSGSSSRNVSVGDVLGVWLDDTILSAMKTFVNASFQHSEFVSSEELLRFVEVELWLCFYKTTPSCFYDSKNSDEYPPAWTAMPESRYRAILKAMGNPNSSGNAMEDRWEPPLTHDRDLAHTSELVRRLSAQIGFVEHETIASLDDDMLRLRSTKVDDIGLAHIKNPKKGYGPVQHGIVSLTTAIFLGGHIATRGETTLDIVKILQRSLCGASTESQIRLPSILHALDRGYQSDAINQHIRSVGGQVVGTYKRAAKFPFTYAKAPNGSQKAIEEKGEKAAYWAAAKRTGSGRSNPLSTQAFALGYRSGLGGVTLCYTTERGFGPGAWSYVCSHKDMPHRDVETVFSGFENGVSVLTETQRTPDWFLLRKFRVTGSVASRIFHQIATATPDTDIDHDPVTDPAVKLTVMMLSLRSNPRGVVDPPARISSSDLSAMSLEELKAACKERGLQVSGSKTVLKERLENYDGSAAPKVSLRGEILSAWFMKPTSSTATKVGTRNETKIAAHVKTWFGEHASIQVEAMKCYGLLCSRGMPFAAFSPDDIAVMVTAARGQFFAVLEYKTRVSDDTLEREQALADRFGVFVKVELVTNGFEHNFKQMIPESSHRSQILHNIVCGGVRDGFLIFASTSRIIRVVHVFVGDPVADTYRTALKVIAGAYMNWVYDASAMVPYFTLNELGHCVDSHTLMQNVALWRALNQIVEQRRRPLPPAQHILPSLISVWNRVKGGIDVYSRYLKNVKSCHASLPPTAAIMLRIIMTLIYNAFQSLQLFRTQGFLNNTELCTSYTAYQNRKAKLSTFREFCHDAAKYLRRSSPPDATPRSSGCSRNEDEDGAGVEQSSREIRYKKRDHFNSDADLIRLRLDKRIQHDLIQIEGGSQQSCVLCCSLNHDSENAGHGRKGFKTRFKCNRCFVALCRGPRWNGKQSCFDKFHSEKALPDPCQVSGQLCKTRQNDNRAAPPSRKRPHSSVDDSNLRSPSLSLTIRERRRSLRIRENR